MSKDFSDFEKEALESSSNDALKLDLQRHLNKLHREQREDIEERISAIEQRCNEEVRKTLEKHVRIQIEKNFQETLESLQEKVFELFSPLVKQRNMLSGGGLRSQEAALNVQLRKKRTRRLIELGGLISKTQLEDWNANTLLGGLLFLKEQEANSSQLDDWTHKGGSVFNEGKTKNLSYQ